jgi:hypothetical protein
VKNQSKAKWLGAAVGALMALTAGSAKAGAGSPSYLNIDVTINSTLSVSVNTVNVSSQAVTWSGASTLTQASTATVTNDSGFFAEQWKLSTYPASKDATDGSAGWTIATTPGVEQVELQAVFGDSAGGTSCTLANYSFASVAKPLSNTTPLTYTLNQLNDATGLSGTGPDNTSTNKMNAGSKRSLCWRLSMPTSTALTNAQVVPVIVTAF